MLNQVSASLGMHWAKEMTKTDTHNRQSIVSNAKPFNLNAFKRKNSLLSKNKLMKLNIKDDKLNTDAVCKILQLSEPIIGEMNIIHTYDFDIFKVRDLTKNNELVTVVSYIMARESIFETLPV
jgi:hypothetical protein